ncbi:MAG: S41 family peptidase [Chloroflexota bacterium]
MKIFLRALLATFTVSLLMMSSFMVGYVMRDREDGSNQSFPILKEAYSILIQHGLTDPPPAPALEYGMVRGMLQAYNEPHTIFVEPVQHELDTNALEGRFGGIGVQLGKDAEGYWVLFPFPEGPARDAGVQEGDRLLSIEGQAITAETSTESLQSSVRGPVGTRVTLEIGRPPDYTPQKISMERAEIPLPSVTWRLEPVDPRLGILDVNLIAATTTKELVTGVEDLKGRGATCFALDLRNNPGGLLTAGVDIASLFLKEGVIIQEQYRGRDVETYSVEKPGELANLPLVVLIDHGSASASEIAAGALQVHQRALLIGTPSYGKDTIQLVFELKDGSSLHITSAHWWIPGLEPPVGSSGLQPDILVEPASDAAAIDPFIQAAIQACFPQP